MKVQTAIWRRHDRAGHDACRVRQLDGGWQIAGVAVFVYERQPCRLDYDIACDAHWVTKSALVRGWLGDKTVDIAIARSADGNWRLNGQSIPGVDGCTDIDLNFSPSTNLLPIRRLRLAVGAAQPVRAAWLLFPSFTLEPLEQTYTRLDESIYQYESAGGSFVALVSVDEIGLAVKYGDIWSRETAG
jgi:uncharacterized protein